ncbi:MAG: helix-turn-helix transcriptional regulator [Pseudomonadota bacterium]
MSENKIPSNIDRIVGMRMRLRRRDLKLTQEQLGEKLGLTFQQVQKYEKGVNRVSAGRLFELSSVLGVPITYFYEGVSEMVGSTALMVAESEPDQLIPTMDMEAIELLTAFQKIDDKDLRKTLLATINAAASRSEKATDS